MAISGNREIIRSHLETQIEPVEHFVVLLWVSIAAVVFIGVALKAILSWLTGS